MSKSCFAYDYGHLPSVLRNTTELLTPADFIDTPEWKTLAAICTEKKCERPLSLYEHFCAVCHALPQLEGHPLKRDLLSFWKRHFFDLPLPEEENANLLWRVLTDRFAKEKTPREAFLPRESWNCLAASDMLASLPHGAVPMPQMDSFLTSGGDTYRTWRERLTRELDAFCLAGCRQILLTMPREFSFTVPDLYHVGVALAKQRRGTEAHSLLLSQLLREVIAECQTRGLVLLLRVLCDGEAVREALVHFKRSIGLPTVVWTTPYTDTARVLLSYSTDEKALLPALLLSDTASSFELQYTLAFYAARYPTGQLQYITAANAPLLDDAQACVKKEIQEILKRL